MENLNNSAGLTIKAPRRIIVVPTYNDSLVLNRIAISSLVSDELPISVLQAKFDVWWHTDVGDKMMSSPQLSEFTFADSDPEVSESEWFSAIMQDPNRDVEFFFNNISPIVIKQFAALQSAGTQLSFFIITNDDKIVGKFDGEYLVPLQIQSSSLNVGLKKIPSWSEHAKDSIKFRLNEARSLDDMFAIPVSGGYVTSDDDYWALDDATCVVSSHTKDGCVCTITKTNRNPETGAFDAVTGIAYTEVVADGTGDDSPAASGNWVETAGGVYTWTETDVFLGDLTKTFEFSHSKIEVAEVESTGT